MTANVASGEVWSNGARLGELPLTAARVPAGLVRIEVRAKGYEAAARAIELAPGATATEELRLKIVAEPPPSAETKAVGRDTTSDRSAAAPDRSRPVVPPSVLASPLEAKPRAFAWGAAGAAVAFLGGAIVAQIIREERTSKYNDDTQCLHGDLSRDERCGVYRGQAESAQALANVGYVAAGAFGVGSAVLFLLTPGMPKTNGANVRLGVGAPGVRLDLTGTF